MPKAENPHDRFFKETLGDPELAVEFLQLYLPSEVANLLDTSRLEIGDTSLADLKLETHLADLLFRVGLKQGGEAYIYVLPEHKSYPDKWVGLQLLSYTTRLCEAAKAQGAKHLPVVFPVVVYHGKRPWPAKSSFVELFGLKPSLHFLREYLPGFRYCLIDLSKYDDGQLVGSAPLAAAFLLLKYVFRPELSEKFPQAFRQLGQAGLPQARLRMRATLMTNYLAIASEVDKVQLGEELMDSVGPEGEHEIMNTIAGEWLREGRQEGLQQGRQEGLQIGQQTGYANIILLQARRRFTRLSAQTEAQIRALSLTDLEELGAALLDFETAQDLTGWLGARAQNQF